MNSDYGDASSITSSVKKKIPYPFLQNLLESANKDGRFSKKMKFEIEPRKELMKYNLDLDEQKHKNNLEKKVS